MSTEKLLAYSSMLSAVAAVIGILVGSYGVYLGSEALKHSVRMEKLRIMPLLDIEYGRRFESEKLKIINVGLGPALIQSAKFSKDGKELEISDKQFSLGNFNQRFTEFSGLQTSSNNNEAYWSLQPIVRGAAIGVNEAFPILVYTMSDGSVAPLTRMPPEISFEVSYCSVDEATCQKSRI